MTKILIGLTIFFFMASAVQLFYLHLRISASPKLDPDVVFGGSPNNTVEGKSDPLKTFLRGLFYLECNTLARRYHQANVLLMSRIWTKYLSFVTGMILCMVGASFILGKLASSKTILEGKTQEMSFTIASSSPGIILTCLGTLLIVVSFFAHAKITVRDAAVYIPSRIETPKEDSSPSLVDNVLQKLINMNKIVDDGNDKDEPADVNDAVDSNNVKTEKKDTFLQDMISGKGKFGESNKTK